MRIEAIFKFIAKHPASMCVAGGILLLLTSPVYENFTSGDPRFWQGGWVLIIIGVLLNILWLLTKKRIL